MTQPAAVPPPPSSPSNETPFSLMVQFLKAQIVKYVRDVWDTVSEDLEVFPPLLRFLVRVGYGGIAILLFLTLFHELVGGFLPHVQGMINPFNEDIRLIEGEAPITVLVIGALVYVIGWAFLFTGATGTSRRLFIPLWIFYLLMAFNMAPSWWQLVLMIPPLVAGIVYIVTYQNPFWRSYSAKEFIGWGGIILLQMLVFLVTSDGEQIVSNLDKLFAGRMNLPSIIGGVGLYYVTIPYWLWLGIEAVLGIGEIAKPIVKAIHQGLTDKYLPFMTIPIQVALLVIQLILFFNAFVFYTFMLVGLLLIGITVVLAVIGKLTPRAALILTWMAVVSAIYHVLLGFIIYDSDPTEFVVKSLIPPGILFMFLMVIDVLTFGKRIAGQDSARFPRAARLMLYFGVAFLFIGTTFFRINLREIGDANLLTNAAENFSVLVSFSFLVLGPFALLWLTWRERKELFAQASGASPTDGVTVVHVVAPTPANPPRESEK